MPCRSLIIFVFLFIAFINPSFAQNLGYLGLEQGLSNNSVTSIYKDKYGFMWFGTLDGLNRFDGYSFAKYRKRVRDPYSLNDNTVYSITGTPDGKLYVGTSKGLSILDYKSLKFSNASYISASLPDRSVLPFSTWVLCLKAQKDNDVFVGSIGSGLLVLKHSSMVLHQIPLYDNAVLRTDYSVESLSLDKNSNVWLLSRGVGLCVYNSRLNRVEIVNSAIKNGKCMTFDSGGNLWIGTNVGRLFKLYKGTDKVEPFDIPGGLTVNRIMDVCFEDGRVLWVSTDGDGLFSLDIVAKTVLKAFTQSEKSLLSNAISTIFIDKESRKWIGTIRGGVNIIDQKKDIFKTVKNEPFNSNSLAHNTVFSFCEDGDDIWIGTDGKGISIWNRKTNNFREHLFKVDKDHLGANQIPSIIKDDKGNVWIGSYGSGVTRFNKATQTFEEVQFQQKNMGSIYAFRLFMDRENDIWVSCLRGPSAHNITKGLYKFDKTSKQFKSVPYAVYKDIFSIAEDHWGNLWLGTVNSILKLDKKSGAVIQYHIGSCVRAIKIDKTGNVWIGSQGSGLWRLTPGNSKFSVYTEEDGLPNDGILNIEEDNQGYIWLATNNGLSKLSPKQLSFENYHADDGLQSNQFYYNASAKLSSGELLFGGIKGFNVFNPSVIKADKNFPALTVTGVNVLNTSITAQSEYVDNAFDIQEVNRISLPFEKSLFSLEFAALEYTFPEKIQYAYILRGKDKAWNYIKNGVRSISYASLMDGSYTLEIKSTNASGVWNPRSRMVRITVLAPWYRTWWMYCLYLTLAGGGVYTYIRYQRQKDFFKYKVKLTALEAVKEAELNEKRISFFTNVAHELRTPLTLIVNPIKDLLNSDGVNIHSVDVGAVYRNTRRLLSLVDQLLLFKSAENEVSELKPEILNLSELCNEVFLCFNNQIKAKHIKYHFDNVTNSLPVFADREKIEIVLFNLLSNAIKYCGEKGSVSFVLRDGVDSVSVLVKNTGPIIPPHVGDQLFDKFFRLNHRKESARKSGFGIGLFVSKKIAEMQKGSLTYTSDDEAGTVFTYQLPKNMDNISPDFRNEKKSSDAHLFGELYIDFPEPASKDEKTISKSMDQVFSDVVERKPNVLVVDDNTEIRNFLEQILHDHYNVFKAENAEDAFNIVRSKELDIIVSDIVMPGISGVEFCSNVKESDEFSHIPVILLTGTTSPEIKLKGIECGADDYITKPFERELLLARIKSILKGRDSLKKYFINDVTLQSNNEKVSEEYSAFLKKATEIVELHLKDKDFNVKVLILEMRMSRSNVFRKVKSISGLSISEFIRYIRLKKAAELMIKTDIQVKEVAYEVGINDSRYFRKQFHKVFGINPSDYIKKYRRNFLKAPGS
ncbi:two-component regulator propeller domain-containing protein [Mucilaginibacter sp. cycad4]|uniref:two-component regulator propeller domain-containing protein n=1 Tax=Mucilaginibacter sp. cycad4 TaxID=3342096 RepID=UPI002AAA6DC9|nr:two-component regulator propeller domain-containing protein [Mucilaginibacter gossypii]WPV00720.1 two-component regulator propeller domain-containing protein [Mucilaginibacter gossypii]